ncbi:nucleic acid-binding, OB-fold protein [Artemisia annua]|uniref:Nucleic acid-binding, OB-fold protein n=1 Tax=Artemisia annua TaxID=35608 RepID=A0A2U1LTS5_ARTAN|nr:nucleic acid-binding, OB-fold protein [Artemisia annua]
MGDLIPFGLNKHRRIVMIEDPEGDRLECCFFDAMADMFVSYASNRENAGHVVLIVQLAKVKYWKDNVSVSPAMNGTKIFINADLPESALKIEILSPTKKTVTPETFFKGAARKNVGDIRYSFNEVTCVVYAKIHKIQKEFGWCYPACKQCSRIAKESEYSDLYASAGDEEYDEDATCVNNVDTAVDSTKLSVDIPVANEDDVRNDNANSHPSTTSSFESGGSKRNAIDIDDTDDGDSEAKRAKI